MRGVKSARTCGDCQFYTPTMGHRGDCRRLAPVVVLSSTRWPLVSMVTLACGQFELRRQTKAIAKDSIDWGVFSNRVKNALRRASITSWEQLRQLETGDILAIPGIGTVAVEEILEVRSARRLKKPARTGNRAKTNGKKNGHA